MEPYYYDYDRSSPYLIHKDCEPLRVDCLTCNEPFDTLFHRECFALLY